MNFQPPEEDDPRDDDQRMQEAESHTMNDNTKAAPQGMTIVGDGASMLGKLMREQRASRLGVYPDGNPNASAPEAAPQGVASEMPRPDIQAILIELDVPVVAYLGGHSGKLVKDQTKLDAFETEVPLVMQRDHRAACQKIAALAQTEQAAPRMGAAPVDISDENVHVSNDVSRNSEKLNMSAAVTDAGSEQCRLCDPHGHCHGACHGVNPDGSPLAHDLYTDADADRPMVICDRNGQVTLGLCKRCGKGESELFNEDGSASECKRRGEAS